MIRVLSNIVEKNFPQKDNLRLYIENRCKAASENVYYKKMFIEMKNELIKEKQDFLKTNESNIEKVGNTTNNTTHNTTNNTTIAIITQNIQLNSYGSEKFESYNRYLKPEC